MNASTYDLAIIGGGPAGCSAAITAAKLGMQVILFEARLYPHDKLCGEFLSPECAGMLNELGAGPGIWKAHPHPIARARLTAADGFAWEEWLPGMAWGLSRKSFDAILAEKAQAAGAVVQPGVAIEAVEGSLEDGFTLDGRSASGRSCTNARAVIAAYGKRSALDRVFNRRFLQRQHPFVASKMHFTGISVPGQVELHTFPGGYCGLSMLEGTFAQEPVTNVCFLARTEVFHQAREAGRKPLESFLEWMRAQNPHLEGRLSQGRQLDQEWISIAQVPFTPKSPIEGDLLMAGDAAGLIVPVAGDGISMALRSGMLAVTLIYRYLDRNFAPAWLRQAYARAWKQRFGRRMALGRVLQALLLHPSLSSASLRLARHFPPLGQYFVSHTREVYQPYDE